MYASSEQVRAILRKNQLGLAGVSQLGLAGVSQLGLAGVRQ